MSNISHSVNRNSCNFYSRTKLNISFHFLLKNISATKLSLLIYEYSCEQSRLSFLSSIMIDTINHVEFNTYTATGCIAFAGLDLAVRITILRCSFLDFIPLAMSEVVSHIASFYVWKFWAGPGYFFAWSNIPWQDCPSPVYPYLQVQWWELSVLVQFAVTSQARLVMRHSSISNSTNDINSEEVSAANE